MQLRKSFGVTLVLLLATSAFAADRVPDGVQSRKSDVGVSVLTDAKGMTLYTFDKDTDGKSVCNGNCAKNWPPLTAGPDAMSKGDWTVVTRDDGSKQWAYKGKALYTWVKDTKPGETTGDGVGNVWHNAVP